MTRDRERYAPGCGRLHHTALLTLCAPSPYRPFKQGKASPEGDRETESRAMAGRRAGKAKPRGAAARDGARRGRAKPAPCEATQAGIGATPEERIAALERERDELRAALERERARRHRLEEVYAAARDRVSRALDSLHTILNAKG
jgi:hypothetical protein